MTKRFLQQPFFAFLFTSAMLVTGLCPAVEPTADFYVSPGGINHNIYFCAGNPELGK